MYLLDTNIISELRRPRPHGAVVAWMKSIDSAHIQMAAVSVAEIQIGIERIRANDVAKAAEIEAWLEYVLASVRIIPADASVYRRWARLMHRNSAHLGEDALIAATALEHGLIVATRNTGDFLTFSVPTLNPFEWNG